ncbi:hypothetical protein MRX96_034920 [Rhipicephalus microplus]
MVTLNVPPKLPPPGRAHCREKVHSPGVTGKTAQQGRAASLLEVRRSGEVGSRERTRRGCKLRVAANCRKSLGWGASQERQAGTADSQKRKPERPRSGPGPKLEWANQPPRRL